MLPLAIFSPGPVELLVIAGIVLLLFGNRLPSVMRSLGRGVIEFKKGVSGVDDDAPESGAEEEEKPASESKP